MARPYNELRTLMKKNDDTQKDIGDFLHISRMAVSQRFRNVTPWKLDEMYAIMDRYGIPHKRLYKIFPPMGRNEAA